MKNSERNKILGCIFATAKECGVDSVIVRESISPAVIGKGLSQADDVELKKVRAHMLDLLPKGKKISAASRARPDAVPYKLRFDSLGHRDGYASPKQLRLIHVTWMKSIHTRQKTDQALRRFLFRQFKVSDLRFVTQDQVGPILKAIKSIR